MNYISMSMASSLEYCAGYNNAVDDANREIGGLEARISELEKWQQKAFMAHPNIDLDIEMLTR